MSNETTVDPYEVVATAVKAIIDTEFAAESVSAIHDKIHESLGQERVTVGITPIREVRQQQNSLVNQILLEIRFYDLWEREISPEQTVNPFKITKYANRLKRALSVKQAGFSGSPEVWYFDWLDTDYPDDPTGNKTRFHMHVRAYGDNTNLIETRA